MIRIFSFVFVWLSMVSLWAQAPLPAQSAAQIQHSLKKLQVTGSVLYLAAHPDDENTRLIAYLAQGKGYRTGYLSLTRGDGGQNLIGTEKGPQLGMLRTQELLAARRIDGAEQMFSRAYDFGYSKTPEETLEIWDREKVLSDVVWAIRKFRPDVIITRFATPEKGGGGHGHHTSSAILAHEAFSLANDPNAFPDQLQYVQPWQPKRLLWNNYWVFRRYEPSEEELRNIITVDIGEYDPLLGKSYGEIASEARSMHRCQAFGTSLLRGSQIEYLELELGEPVQGGLFDGIDASWSRLRNGEQIGELLGKAYAEFQATDPSRVLPHLLKAYELMKDSDHPLVAHKREQLLQVIAHCSGLWFEYQSEEAIVAQGDTAEVDLLVLKRSDVPIELTSIDFGVAGLKETPAKELPKNGKPQRFQTEFLTQDLPISQPYWLEAPQAKGIFQVDDRQLIGLPQNEVPVIAELVMKIQGTEVRFSAPLVHMYVDRSVGQLYRPFVISPPVTINISEKVLLFASNEAQEVNLLVKNHREAGPASISISGGEGWSISPSTLELDFEQKGEEQIVSVQVTPPANQNESHLRASATVGGNTSSNSFQEIAYRHIPTQPLFAPSEARLVRVNLKKRGDRIGYLMGSGDEVPTALKQIGYQVDLLSDDDITPEKLAQYDAIIAGIRAYNRNKRMAFHQDSWPFLSPSLLRVNFHSGIRRSRR
ncbi:MAG: PIG-L family deacetylase [Bacteroidota bacterium]